eukprot:3936180-Rhodomonas_salina.1
MGGNSEQLQTEIDHLTKQVEEHAQKLRAIEVEKQRVEALLGAKESELETRKRKEEQASKDLEGLREMAGRVGEVELRLEKKVRSPPYQVPTIVVYMTCTHVRSNGKCMPILRCRVEHWRGCMPVPGESDRAHRPHHRQAHVRHRQGTVSPASSYVLSMRFPMLTFAVLLLPGQTARGSERLARETALPHLLKHPFLIAQTPSALLLNPHASSSETPLLYPKLPFTGLVPSTFPGPRPLCCATSPSLLGGPGP